MTPADVTSAAQQMHAMGAEVTSWTNGPGDRFTAHRHAFDKVLVVTSGSITFLVAALAIEMEAGERLDLPADTDHAAVVGRTGVECLEGHLPRGTLGGHPRRVAGWGTAAASGILPAAETADGHGA